MIVLIAGSHNKEYKLTSQTKMRESVINYAYSQPDEHDFTMH